MRRGEEALVVTAAFRARNAQGGEEVHMALYMLIRSLWSLL
jgi:hypothetical protein